MAQVHHVKEALPWPFDSALGQASPGVTHTQQNWLYPISLFLSLLCSVLGAAWQQQSCEEKAVHLELLFHGGISLPSLQFRSR